LTKRVFEDKRLPYFNRFFFLMVWFCFILQRSAANFPNTYVIVVFDPWSSKFLKEDWTLVFEPGRHVSYWIYEKVFKIYQMLSNFHRFFIQKSRISLYTQCCYKQNNNNIYRLHSSVGGMDERAEEKQAKKFVQFYYEFV